MRQWLSDIWNLTRIFDKYLPKIKSLLETVDRQQRQMEDLRQEIIDMKKDIAKLKGATPTTGEEKKPTIVVPEGFMTQDGFVEYTPDSKPVVTKVDKYYDPQLGVEYTTIKINGDKGSPDEDTVKE